MNRGKAPARGGRHPQGGGAAESTDEAGGSTARLESAGTPSTTARRGAATSRATRAPSVGRFRPKAIRRDEADRDVLARQEEQKARERAAEERRAHGRSRNKSKRSRGDAMGSRGRGTMTASGPFSGGFAGCTSPWTHDIEMGCADLSNSLRTIGRLWRVRRRRWRRRWRRQVLQVRGQGVWRSGWLA